MADIAQAAGIAVGTLYNYFGSKEEIFREIAFERGRELQAQLEPALRTGTPSERIAVAVRTALDYVDQHGALLARFVERGGPAELDLQRIGFDPHEAEHERFLRLLIELVRAAQTAGELRPDVPAAVIATALSGAMNGATRAWLKRGRRGRLAVATDDL